MKTILGMALGLLCVNGAQAACSAADQAMLGIAAGGVLGLVGSWLSVGRHLRHVWRDA